jgi:hemerythrin-like domain-containing protein
VNVTLRDWHRQLARRLDAWERGGADAPALSAMLDMVTAHIAVERAILYPEARRVAGVTTHVEERMHERLKIAVVLLATSGFQHRPFEVKVRELRELVARHVTLEEEELLPALERALDVASQAALVEKLRREEERLARGPISTRALVRDDDDVREAG